MQNHLQRTLDLDEVKAQVFLDTITNPNRYLNCMPYLSMSNMISEMRKYLLEKCYNSDYGDVLPFILANAFGVNVTIMVELPDGSFNMHKAKPQINTSGTIVLHRKDDHFNGTSPYLSALHVPVLPRNCNPLPYTQTRILQRKKSRKPKDNYINVGSDQIKWGTEISISYSGTNA